MFQKVGIPRALLYYKYFPMWRAFLEKLGAEIIVSEGTNQQTVLQGASRVVSDTCLPVKVFIGHVIELTGKCDCILIPVVRSTRKKVSNCSRFLGLPDMTRAVVPEAPPIIEIEFDLNRGRWFLYRQIYSLGRNFTLNPLKIRKAASFAWEAYSQYNDMMRQNNLSRVEAIDLMLNPAAKQVARDSRREMTIGLVGHPYVLHDEQVSHRLINRLRSQGIKVLMPEMARGTINRGPATPSRYWESEEDVIDAGDFYTANGVDGIIGMMAFGCGPDSLMMHLVQRQAQTADIPFMCLTVEEHTAEAGVVTRLEAFTDMIRRHKKKAG